MRQLGIIPGLILLANLSTGATIHVPVDQPTIQAGGLLFVVGNESHHE